MHRICIRLVWSDIAECSDIDNCVETRDLIERIFRKHDIRINMESIGIAINGRPGELNEKLCKDALITVFRVFKGG
ncbi:MAG: hypothetical protein QXP02_01165 [Desulfurococcaceae archaeon]